MADKKWLVQSCCNKGLTQIVANNNLLPGYVFKDSLGDCYTVLMGTNGTPTIIITNELIYASCEACGTCVSTSPTPTPSVTQTPAPTQTIPPSVSVTPSSTPYIFVSKTPSVTPSPSLCACTYRNVTINSGDILGSTNNTDASLNNKAFVAYYDCNNNYVSKSYTTSGSFPNDICWNVNTSVPTTYFFSFDIQTAGKSTTTNTSTCCVPVSPTPTPSPSPVSGSDVVIEDLCMGVTFGPAPSASVTPSPTPTVTPSITVSPSSYPIFPSITPTATPSVTPSVTPSITPSNSISSTPSVTPSITPTRTVTPSVSISLTPSISVTPSKTPTPSPSQSSGSLVLSECSVIYNGPNVNEVYAYNSATNVSTLLNLGTSPLTGGSRDIAHTPNKLWLYRTTNNTTTLYEYNITLNPFTSVFNRAINLPIGTSLGAGLCAIDDTTLISSIMSVGQSNVKPNQIVQINLDLVEDGIDSLTYLFSLPSSRMVSGDIMYTVDGKIIVTTQTRNAPYSYWISQYALINGVWTLEFDQNITATAPWPYGLATINGGIYIFSGTNLKQIDNNFPYTVTQVNNINNLLEGASQVVKCNTVTFQPNIIGASSSPSPTPTRTVTPSITASPSVTPSRTPTPTPSPSAANSNCTGALPLPGGSLVYNGIIVTASGTGAINTLYPNYIASCAITSQINTINLGYPGPLLDFSYTLTFSQPVNNIKLLLTDVYGTAPFIEYFTFTTNIGTPTVLSNDSCYVSISGNTVTGTGANGGGTFAISALSPYTTLTVTGKGGGQGGSTPMSIDCNSISPFQSSCNSCDIQSLPVGGNGTIVSNNVTLTTTYSGPQIPTAILPNPTNMTCVGLASPSLFQTVVLGYNSGAFIYTINFSQPVNNIKFLIDGAGATSDPTSFEYFTFNTDGGVPTLTSCGPSCATTINNNTLQMGYVLPYGGGILTQVSALNNYTRLIITGPGGLQGSTFALCADTAIISPSTSPSPTPSVTVTPSKTPSVTATPSVTPSKTPSITPTKTTTPSVTPSKSPGFVADCNTIFYKTQTSQYYSYNFSTNTSTLLNVPVPPNDSVAISLSLPVSNLTNTSNKLWSYTWNNNSGNNNNSIVEYNTTSGPFTATINRYIALPKISNQNVFPGSGLFAISNEKLIGTIAKIGSLTLQSSISLPTIVPLAEQYANGIIVAEFDITSNVATWTQKVKLFPGELPATGILLTSNNKLIIITKDNQSPFTRYINQYNYSTGLLEFKQPLPATINTDCGLAEVNGNIYLIGFNVYRFDATAPYALTFVQTIGNQTVAASQLAGCITNSLPTSSCPECIALPLKLTSSMDYNGMTIVPSYIGPAQSPSFFAPTDQLNPGPFQCCTGPDAIYIPPYTVWLGQQSGNYSYTLTFSQFVNNIKIQYKGTNDNLSLGGPSAIPEVFTWTTNGGTPSISLCKGCYQTINGNVVSGSDANSGTPGEIGGGIITITAPSSYTTLTLSGTGRNNGTLFSICSSSIIPAPIPSPSPSATPSVTVTPTPTPSASPINSLLGCVYYSNYNNPNKTWLYNVSTNVSTLITLSNDLFGTNMNAHTSTRFWKTNQIDIIIEWAATNSPTTLNFNRNITFSGLSSQFYQISGLQAIDNTTLLTLQVGAPIYNNPAGPFTYSLARLDITNNTITADQMTILFSIYAPAGINDFLLTSTNKIIVVGRRTISSQLQQIYLSQYSYPDGTLELDINLSAVIPPYDRGIGTARCRLFESNGNLFLSVLALNSASSTIYNVNLNSPYDLTFVRTITDNYQKDAWYNSSLNCTTVNLIPPPVPSPSPTPSTSPPSNAFRTIYKYLDIQ